MAGYPITQKKSIFRASFYVAIFDSASNVTDEVLDESLPSAFIGTIPRKAEDRYAAKGFAILVDEMKNKEEFTNKLTEKKFEKIAYA